MFEPLGEDIPAAIESSLKLSRHVLLVLSPEAMESNWVALEYSASLYKDPSAAARVLIPILRKDCDIPLVLGRLKYLDARGEDFERQVRHLLNGIEHIDISSKPADRHYSDRALQMNYDQKKYLASRGLCTSSPIPVDSEMIYIEREADIQVRRAIEENDLIVIFGPRKIGKTSLLNQAHKYALSIDRKVGYIDFQMFGSGTSAPQLYFSLCSELHSKLHSKKPDVEEFMNSPQHALYNYLRSIPQNSILIFDELDMLKGVSLLEDFTTILRAFYSAAYSQGEQRISILIVSYLPPIYYIENPLGSPFNVGRSILLSNFNRREAEVLLKLIVPPLSVKEGDSIHNLFGGHPYMLQLAVEFLIKGNTIEDLFNEAVNRQGEFGFFVELQLMHMGTDVIKLVKKFGLKGLTSAEITKLKQLGIIETSGQTSLKWSCGLFEAIFNEGKKLV